MTSDPTPIAIGEEADRLTASITMLERQFPELSVRRTTPAFRRVAVVVSAAIVISLFFDPFATASTILGIMTALFLISLTYRVGLVFHRPSSRRMIRVSDEEAGLAPDDELPIYTVLLPAYREPESLVQSLSAIDQLDYPKDKLDLKLLLEADDAVTIMVARQAAKEYAEIVIVPSSEPRTKPKALNYGLLGARGEYVTIFDAEDIPERLQLRRAVAAFARLPERTACLQARLGFYNSRQNQLTKWFTLDYALWFNWFLPNLVDRRTVVPLGGTSNHFRRDVLIRTGAWDSFNVTEDADLGIRLRRLGYDVELLDTTTLEEATSDPVNWIKQRSRWYKGYLQTWLVHLRHPRTLYKELGPRSFVSFNMFIGGTPILAICNVATWALTAEWIAANPAWIHQLFPRVVYYPALFSFVAGNILCIYMGLLCAREMDDPDLVVTAILMPLYWLMMSLAALKATIQLVIAPSFWEKTVHGLSGTAQSGSSAQPGPGLG